MTKAPPPNEHPHPQKRQAERAEVEAEARRRSTCERCGAVMFDRHCKVICPNCGYMRDCSDP